MKSAIARARAKGEYEPADLGAAVFTEHYVRIYRYILSLVHDAIETEDLTEVVPAFATIAMTVFTYNVANGLTAGLLLHPILKVVAGRRKELHPGGIALAGLCAVYYLFGLPH